MLAPHATGIQLLESENRFHLVLFVLDDPSITVQTVNPKPLPGPQETYIFGVPYYDFLISVIQKVGYLGLR